MCWAFDILKFTSIDRSNISFEMTEYAPALSVYVQKLKKNVHHEENVGSYLMSRWRLQCNHGGFPAGWECRGWADSHDQSRDFPTSSRHAPCQTNPWRSAAWESRVLVTSPYCCKTYTVSSCSTIDVTEVLVFRVSQGGMTNPKWSRRNTRAGSRCPESANRAPPPGGATKVHGFLMSCPDVFTCRLSPGIPVNT